jgi:hypothetical protein
VDVELARHQWAEGRRAIERTRDDREAYARLSAYVSVLVDELTRRIGQTFTTEQLVGEYDRSHRWTLETLDDAFPDEVPADASIAADAAFDVYAHRASDYIP